MSDMRGKWLRPALTFDRMLAQQNGKCAICRRDGTSITVNFGGGMDKKDNKLQVDHDHTTNLIRGLLCSHCNRGIGCFGDDINLLESAMRYIQRSEERKEAGDYVI